MSKLRRKVGRFITSTIGGGYSFGEGLRADNSRVDYTKARALYENNDENYKLGSGFSKRVINAKAGFMGVPSFNSDDAAAKETLDAFFEGQTSKMARTHIKALSEGDCFVWISREETDRVLYPESGARLVYTIIPNEEVVAINRDPITRQVKEYVLKSTLDWTDDNQASRCSKVTQWISAERRLIRIDGDPIPGMEPQQEIPNPWGFLPIEHFRNEGNETMLFGQSDLEPIEPFLKAYHDVMLYSLQGSQMHSTPRLKFKLKDVAAFIRNNFGIEDPAKFAAEGKTIQLDGKEFLILTEGEDVSFIEANNAMGSGVESLLKLLYYCIISASETPEFVFGVHTPSAQASVQEQMPVFVRMISRKREMFAENWQRLARMVLAMTSRAQLESFSTFATTLEWEEIDPRDEKEAAETLDSLTTALETAINCDILSVDSAAAFLRDYIPTMKEYDSDDDNDETELKRIIKHKLIKDRLADGSLGIDQVDKIIRELAG